MAQAESPASSPPLPEGYSARPATMEDAPAVAAVIAACEEDSTGRGETTPEGVRSDWQTMDTVEDEVIVVTDARGGVVASADVLNRDYVQVFIYGYVLPEHRGRGIGSYLVAWGEDWARGHMHNARPDARIDVRHYVNGANKSGQRLLEARGYPAVRGVHIMEVAFTRPPPEPKFPPGLTVRSFVVDQDEPAAYEAVEDSFRDHWGRTPNTLDNFVKVTHKDSFDPELSSLAEEDGRLVGICNFELEGETGWIGTIGVRREWRKRGLGLALLHRSFSEGYRRGIRKYKLSVDSESPTNAPGLYRRAGMEVKDNFIIYEKVIRPGKDYTTLAAETDQEERVEK